MTGGEGDHVSTVDGSRAMVRSQVDTKCLSIRDTFWAVKQ